MKKNDEIKNETMETVIEEVKDVTVEETQNETEEKVSVFSKARAFYDKHSTAFKVGGAFVLGLVLSYAVSRNASNDGDEEGEFTIIDLDPVDCSESVTTDDSYSGYDAE